MQNAIESTVSAARSAQAGLVAAVHRAADALDEVGRDPLVEALGRLAESAAGAQQRLQAGRAAAADILLGALAAFGGFEAEVGEPAQAAALDEVGRDPLVEALGRLAESAAGAQARLQAGRAAAADILLGALAAFGGFEAEVNAPAPAAALPAPVAPEPVPEPTPEASEPAPEPEEEAPEAEETKSAPAPAKKATANGRKPEPAGKGRARDRPGRVR